MIAHVVLFRQRADLAPADHAAFTRALEAARQAIPTIRRFLVGRRVVHGAVYEQVMTADFPFAAVIEFENLAGLQTYLAHPAHEEVGRLFWALCAATLVYDYEMETTLGTAD